MRFEWDEAKRRTNLTRHGIDFADLAPVFESAPLTKPDDRYDYGEERFFTLGLLGDSVVAISHTWTQDVIRIISARRALRNEEITYFKEIWN
jgi:uncharacterized DUF497 family protein